jgi:hypothetical protein
MMKSISGRFRFLLLCLIGLGLVVGPFLSVSGVLAQRGVSVGQAAPALQTFQQEGEASCLQPPTNVNLLTLSDAQLALYGFPAHAVINQDRPRWENTLAYARHRVCGSSPATSAQRIVNGPTGTQMANVTVSKQYGFHWGGDSSYWSSGAFRSAVANFYVPALQPSSPTQNSYVSFWVGLGGDAARAGSSAYELIQAGISMQVTPNGTQTATAFWENEGAKGSTGQQPLGFSVAAHDYIFADVTSNLGGDGYNSYTVDDETSGRYNTVFFSNYFTDGETGECIAEVNFGLLADFGTEEFYGCTIGTNSITNTINNWNHYYWIPTTTGTSSGTVLITAGPISSTGNFNVVWKG